MKKHRVFVVDDHPIVRQGLALLINRERDLEVCGEAHDTWSAMQAITAIRPDIIVVDISLKGPSGIDILKNLRRSGSRLPALVLSMHDELIHAERALRAGANGYMMKQEATEQVLVALRRILGGDIYVSERVANMLFKQMVGAPSVRHSPVDGLTDRELQVFRLIGEGQGTRQIADQLHLSIKTVESYQARMKEKLSLKSARELALHAIRWVTAESQ